MRLRFGSTYHTPGKDPMNSEITQATKKPLRRCHRELPTPNKLNLRSGQITLVFKWKWKQSIGTKNIGQRLLLTSGISAHISGVATKTTTCKARDHGNKQESQHEASQYSKFDPCPKMSKLDARRRKGSRTRERACFAAHVLRQFDHVFQFMSRKLNTLRAVDNPMQVKRER